MIILYGTDRLLSLESNVASLVRLCQTPSWSQ